MAIASLPKIMVAPNGARRTKAEHPAVPVTVAETVAVAKACFEAGADGLHAHVRDTDQQHVLDAGQYLELMTEMARQVPDMFVQITTESVGRYSPTEQRDLAYKIKPHALSVSLKEMMSDGNIVEATRFYHWANEAEISVQHILYGASEVERLLDLVQEGIIPKARLQMLFVLGRYTKGQNSSLNDLGPFLQALSFSDAMGEWGVCAFGKNETKCLLDAAKRGGKLRIGFENSIWNEDGSVALSNAERVKHLVKKIQIAR